MTSDLEGHDLRGQHQQVVLQEGGDLLHGQLGEQRRLWKLHKVLQDEAAGGLAHGHQAVGGGDVPDVDAGLDVELGQQEVHAHLEELRDLEGGGGGDGAADGVEGHVDATQIGEGDDVGQACRRRATTDWTTGVKPSSLTRSQGQTKLLRPKELNSYNWLFLKILFKHVLILNKKVHWGFLLIIVEEIFQIKVMDPD